MKETSTRFERFSADSFAICIDADGNERVSF